MFDENGKLTLIDFGLSTFHINNDERKLNSFIGNVIYASPNVHNLKVAKEIDDVISVSYVYMYLCGGGKLYWMNINDTTYVDDSKMNVIFKRKKIDNIDFHLLSNYKIDKKFITFLRKLYLGTLCYNL